MKRNRLKKILVLVLLFLNLVNISYAARFPVVSPRKDFYLYDDIGIVNDQLEDHIVGVNKKLEAETGAQVVVALVDDLGGIDINSYATELFEQWGIGSRDRDNGILLIVTMNPNSIWIETGYGLEGAFPDTIQKRIIEEDILPSFKQGRYEEGIYKGFNRIIAGIEKEYNIDLDGLDIQEEAYVESGSISWRLVVFILLLIFIDLKFFKGSFIQILGASSRNSRYRGPRGPRPPFGGGGSGGSSGSSGGGGRSGGGGAGGTW